MTLLSLSFIAVSKILQEDGVMTAREQMVKLVSIYLEEWPALLVFVGGKPRQIQVLWGGNKVPRSYYIPSMWDSKAIAFSIYVVEEILPPAV